MSAKTDYSYPSRDRADEPARLEKQAKALGVILEREFAVLKLRAGMNVLDAGCGTGAVTRRLARVVDPGVVTGVDLSFLDQARKLTDQEGIRNVRFEQANLNNLPFPDENFDASYSRLVMQHLADPARVLREMARVTKKDGIVAASDIDDAALIWHPATPALAKLREAFRMYSGSHGSDRHVGRKLYSYMTQAGLKQVEIHPMMNSATREKPEMIITLIGVFKGVYEQSKQEMIDQGFTTSEEFDQGIRELTSLSEDPGAFMMGTTFLSIGHVV